jgi:cell volume regulation protein A
MISEPLATAWLLVTGGILLVLSVVLSRTSGRLGIPIFLLFLLVGMLAGSDGLGGIAFDDYQLAFRLGTIALVLILFDGGLNTPIEVVRAGMKPAVLLATVGVVGTAAVVACGAWLLGLPWPMALLIGAVVSSTDAAAVFSTLRASNLHLKRRVGTTLELESGLNDPVAVILTVAVTSYIAGQQVLSPMLAVDIAVQLAVGAAVGLVAGFAGRWLLQKVRLPASGLYAVLSLSIAALSFGIATVLWGSGFLSVYVTAVVIGNSRYPYRSGVARFHDAAAWLSQVMMFILLGLLVMPSELLSVLALGIALSLVLVFLARPLIVFLCLAPLGFPLKESAYIGWIGLRGAVPIVLATFPVLAGIDGAGQVFNIVFFVVVFTALIPGATVGQATRWLGLTSNLPPPPPAILEITSFTPIHGEMVSFFIRPESAVCGSTIRNIPFPPRASVLLIVRGEDLIVPRGNTVLEPNDHVYVLASPGALPLLRLLFGMVEEI